MLGVAKAVKNLDRQASPEDLLKGEVVKYEKDEISRVGNCILIYDGVNKLAIVYGVDIILNYQGDHNAIFMSNSPIGVFFKTLVELVPGHPSIFPVMCYISEMPGRLWYQQVIFQTPSNWTV
jgi:hypothetical protein